MVFHWSLRDSKSSQISRTLLSIQAVLNNVVVWMVCTLHPIFKFSRPFSPLVTVPCAPITIGIIATFMFHSFFQFTSKVEVLSVLDCTLPGQKSRQFCKFSFFVVDYYKVWSSGRNWLIRFYGKLLLLLLLLLLLFTPLEFFPSALADGLSLEFEW